MAKRVVDILCSAGALIVLLPLLAALALWVKVTSQGPVFFRQVRVGRRGVEFRIFKFRTMHVDAERAGPQLTIGGDHRITPTGRFLRRYKLDELPQLVNVLVGDMSLVGPRPEVPRYVARYPSNVRDVILSVRPGITDLASIAFRDENEILRASADPERTYIEEIMPVKLRYYEEYVRRGCLALDVKIVVKTLMAVCSAK